MYKLFLEILSALLTVGGTGIINYIIAEKVDAIDKIQQGTNREKALALVFSMFNLFLYVILNTMLTRFFKGNWLIVLTMLCTIAISLGLTFLGARLINSLFYKAINQVRNQDGLDNKSSSNPWNKAFELNGSRNQMVYLYDFNHNKLGFGWRTSISNDSDNNFSILFIPQYASEPEGQPSYEEVEKIIQGRSFRENYTVRQFVSYKQNIIAIVTTLKNN